MCIKVIFHFLGGQYYYADNAWKYIQDFTGIDLKEILEKIARSREGNGDVIQ